MYLTEDRSIKLTGFEMARGTEGANHTRYGIGTKGYMPPELWHKKQYDRTVDVFSFGCVIFDVFARAHNPVPRVKAQEDGPVDLDKALARLQKDNPEPVPASIKALMFLCVRSFLLSSYLSCPFCLRVAYCALFFSAAVIITDCCETKHQANVFRNPAGSEAPLCNNKRDSLHRVAIVIRKSKRRSRTNANYNIAVLLFFHPACRGHE